MQRLWLIVLLETEGLSSLLLVQMVIYKLGLVLFGNLLKLGYLGCKTIEVSEHLRRE